jgi:alpha-beta hydrolase superfamily lysophospholipase
MKVLVDREIRFYELNYETEIDNDQIPISLYHPLYNSLNHIVLILYGGHPNCTQMDLKAMKDEFAHNGLIAASFDYRGNTLKTKQRFFETGIATRIEDAKAIIDKIKTKNPACDITLIGISMGGYVATHCLESVQNLILIAPAAYHRKAAEYPFGPDFSKIIREPRSWENSDSFEKIGRFSGNLLIIQFGKDEIVPPEIPHKYLCSAAAPDKTLKVLAEYNHNKMFRGKKQEDILITCLDWLKTKLSPF